MKKNAARFLRMLQNSLRNKELFDFIVRIIVIFIIFFILFTIGDNLINKKKVKTLEKNIKMSVYNDGSSGVMAFKELLESLNFKIEKIVEPLSGVKLQDNSLETTNKTIESEVNPSENLFKRDSVFKKPGLILIIEPEMMIDEKNARSIEKMVNYGYNIVIITRFIYKIDELLFPLRGEKKKLSLFSFLNDNTDDSLFENTKSESVKLIYDKNNIFNELKELEISNITRFDKIDKSWQIITKDKYGSLIIEKNIGKGKLVLMSDSSYLSNYNIRKKDNGLFAYRLVDYYSKKFVDKVVYFDEYHHGYQRSLTLYYFIANPQFFAVIIQIVIFLIILFYILGIKFGQYKNEIKPIEDNIYYYSEGIAGLLAKNKYTKNIFDLILTNYYKFNSLNPLTVDKNKLKTIDSFLNLNNKKNKTKNDVIKLYKIINK